MARDTAPPAGPTLRVQTVLYRTHPDQVARFAESFAAAVAQARRARAISTAELAVGDSSDEPVLPGPGGVPGGVPGDVPGGVPRDVPGDLLGAFSSVTYRHFGQNLGSAGGHNALFADATTDLVLVANPDTYASPRLVSELVAAMADPRVGIAEARQLPLEHPKAREPGTGDVSWASGACFLVRAGVLEETGGFDADLFFLHGDDVDLSWRTRLAGWRVVHRPAARVFHDKRLDARAVIRAGAGEVEHSARASVLLPWRYSRPDLALERLRALESSDDEVLQSVGRALRARVDAGDMPEPIDPGHRVGEFVGGEYASHRFSYADP